jgi:hypothetical protein
MGQTASDGDVEVEEVGTDDEAQVYVVNPEVKALPPPPDVVVPPMPPPNQLVIVMEFAYPLTKLKLIALSRDPTLKPYLRENKVWQRWIVNDFRNCKMRVSEHFFDDLNLKIISYRKLYVAMLAVNKALDSDRTVLLVLHPKAIEHLLIPVTLSNDGFILKTTFVYKQITEDEELATKISLSVHKFIAVVNLAVPEVETTRPIFSNNGKKIGATFEGTSMRVWLMVVYMLIKTGLIVSLDDPEDKTTKYYLNEPICANCEAPADQICDACNTVHYCSVECQTDHWKTVHKGECKQ